MITSFRGPYNFLSNFAKCPILYEGMLYPTAEHAFQAAKFSDENTKRRIAGLKAPADAKKFGREHSKEQIKDWGSMRIPVMEEILRIKFNNAAFRDMLLDTGNEHLEEGNEWGDKFWGTVMGEGANNMGILLMKIRKELQDANMSKVQE